MALQRLHAELPRWAAPVALGAAVAIAGAIGWRIYTQPTGYVGPPKKVYPGMYNLKAEVEKMQAARRLQRP
jgi:hypothetical protein